MSKLTTVMGSNGRRYEVRFVLYGSHNYVHRLFYGGIFLCSSASKGPNGESSTSMEVLIERANEMADKLGIRVD